MTKEKKRKAKRRTANKQEPDHRFRALKNLDLGDLKYKKNEEFDAYVRWSFACGVQVYLEDGQDVWLYDERASNPDVTCVMCLKEYDNT